MRNRSQNSRNDVNRNDRSFQGGGQQGFDPRLDPRLFGGLPYGGNPAMAGGYGVPGMYDPRLAGPQGQNPNQGNGRRGGRGRNSGQGQGRGLGGQGWNDGLDAQIHGQRGERQEQGQFRGVGPKGFTRSDDRLREDVSLVLADHPHIDASNIDVKVTSGEVTLTGEVQDIRTKQLVAQVLHRIPGVQQIFDTIRVARRDVQADAGSSTNAGSRTARDQRPHAS